MFWALLWRKANAQNIRWETLYGVQFTSSTQSIKQNCLVILPHQHRTTVSLETYPFDNYCVWRNTIAISWIHWVVVSQMSFLVWVLVVHTWTWSSTLTLYPELKRKFVIYLKWNSISFRVEAMKLCCVLPDLFIWLLCQWYQIVHFVWCTWLQECCFCYEWRFCNWCFDNCWSINLEKTKLILYGSRQKDFHNSTCCFLAKNLHKLNLLRTLVWPLTKMWPIIIML